MTQVPWLLAVGFVALGTVACSGPDVPVVENGSAGAAAGSSVDPAGGNQGKGSPSGAATSGASSTADASGGTKGTSGPAGGGGGGSDAAGGVTGAAGDDSGLGGSPSTPGCNGTECADQFDCGTQLKCDRSTTYCAVTPTKGGSADYACVTIPNQCLIAGSSLCACLAKDPCTSCTESFGAVTLTCPP